LFFFAVVSSVLLYFESSIFMSAEIQLLLDKHRQSRDHITEYKLRHLLDQIKTHPSYPKYLEQFSRQLLLPIKHVKANNSSAALLEAVQISNQQVEASRAIMTELNHSKATLKTAGSELTEVNVHLDAGKEILDFLASKDSKDMMLLFLGLFVFFATVVYINWKRM
jgi:hypothetical protein